MHAPLWRPSESRIAAANMTRFMDVVRSTSEAPIPDFGALWQWSTAERAAFWETLWEFVRVVAERRGPRTLLDGDQMPGARWFPDARLNFAENLLRRRDDGEAIIFQGEGEVQSRMTFAELHAAVARTARSLRTMGIRPGDRVAGYLPNMPQTIVAMLAAASVGAIWSSCSPDFGVRGVLDRFGQIEPRVLLSADGYYYKGRPHDSLGRLREILAGLPSVERTVIVPYTRDRAPVDGLPAAVHWEDWLTAGASPGTAADEVPTLRFEQLPFDHPLYIMYSSGTTGVPKCIVHGAGGTLLQQLKEHVLHCDVRRDDRVFYFTTCGWMMWNWLVAALACEATLLLYDGNPFHPGPETLFELAERERMTHFGTSAKYIDAVAKSGYVPRERHDLSSVRVMTSTGSPLAPESFDWVYENVKQDLCLASISGGTDIISCFVLGNPIGPVWRGEIQTRGLGMAVDVFDDDGAPLRGDKGELVCTAPFPSMPVGFWNDPDGARYRAAYFERFEGVWCHGDWVELTERGGMVIHGRSDAVLNPGGVRIGTAEIYRQVEQMDEILEALVVGQDWDNDVRVVLFVVLRGERRLDDDLRAAIRHRIRAHTTPRHVPAIILQVDDIPRTKSGKITELAVRNVIHGRAVKNRQALANPEALEQFAGRAELR